MIQIPVSEVIPGMVIHLKNEITHRVKAVNTMRHEKDRWLVSIDFAGKPHRDLRFQWRLSTDLVWVSF